MSNNDKLITVHELMESVIKMCVNKDIDALYASNREVDDLVDTYGDSHFSFFELPLHPQTQPRGEPTQSRQQAQPLIGDEERAYTVHVPVEGTTQVTLYANSEDEAREAACAHVRAQSSLTIEAFKVQNLAAVEVDEVED